MPELRARNARTKADTTGARRSKSRFRPRLLILLAAGALAGCSPRFWGVETAPDPPLREVTLRVLRAPPLNLYDRGTEALGVALFDGPGGAALARRLATQIEASGAFRVVPPGALGERLLRAGVALEWESSASTLRWAHERSAIDAAVVGRVEIFEVEERCDEKETLLRQPTGRKVFVLTEEGKLAYQDEMEATSAPLYCRSDFGRVAASYRVYDLRKGAQVATVRHELSTELASFCYRGDVPEHLQRQAQRQLLEKLFQRLNQQFIEEISPRIERAPASFEVLPGGFPVALIHRNELGILCATRGEWSRAIEAWQDCLADNPDLAAAHYNLAVVYRATARFTLAELHLLKALDQARRPLYLKALRDVRSLLGDGAL